MCHCWCLGGYSMSGKEPITVSDDVEDPATESENSCFIATRDGTILRLKGAMAPSASKILNFFC
jgi:hypothetical protein